MPNNTRLSLNIIKTCLPIDRLCHFLRVGTVVMLTLALITPTHSQNQPYPPSSTQTMSLSPNVLEAHPDQSTSQEVVLRTNPETLIDTIISIKSKDESKIKVLDFEVTNNSVPKAVILTVLVVKGAGDSSTQLDVVVSSKTPHIIDLKTKSAATQNSAPNGITVSKPKQFDQRSLTLMLQNLEARLARTQFPDPSGLYGSIGNYAGATARTTSMSLSLRGPSLPEIKTTDKADTKNTSLTELSNVLQEITRSKEDDRKDDKTTNTTKDTTDSSSSSERQVTQPGFAPPPATLPDQTSFYSYQPNLGVSPQDLLTEQTALFYQIINLRMLLEGSVTDRIDVEPFHGTDGKVYQMPQQRVQAVVGFQISIEAGHKNAVAEAEITIKGRDPKLVSLLPRDKTYNVASMRKDSKAADIGAVVQFVGVGAAAGKSSESIYIVKDTDTVALERMSPSPDGSIKFAWQFRPVLGRNTVEPGTRQVYALVSLPNNSQRGGWQGSITATTKWRRYDSKNKMVGAEIKGILPSVLYEDVLLPLLNASATDNYLSPRINNLEWSEVGNGQVLVIADGEGFTPDTHLVFGDAVMDRPENGFTVVSERRLRIVASGQKLAQTRPILVGRYGTLPLKRSLDVYYPQYGDTPSRFIKTEKPYDDFKLKDVEVWARDPQNSYVSVILQAKEEAKSRNTEYLLQKFPPVIQIGKRVYGLGDAPFSSVKHASDKSNAKFTLVVPTPLLADVEELSFKEFLWDEGALTAPLPTTNKNMALGVTTGFGKLMRLTSAL